MENIIKKAVTSFELLPFIFKAKKIALFCFDDFYWVTKKDFMERVRRNTNECKKYDIEVSATILWIDKIYYL